MVQAEQGQRHPERQQAVEQLVGPLKEQLGRVDQQLVRLQSAFTYASNQARTIHTIDLTPDYNVPVTFNQ